MINRIGFSIKADPIENGFLCLIKYADVARQCYCEDWAAVKKLIAEVGDDWEARSEEIAAAADERPLG